MNAIEQMQITGAKIYCEIPLIPGAPFGLDKLIISEAQVNSWIVILLVTILCIVLTRGMKVRPASRRQIIAEFLVEKNAKIHPNFHQFYYNMEYLIPLMDGYVMGKSIV